MEMRLALIGRAASPQMSQQRAKIRVNNPSLEPGYNDARLAHRWQADAQHIKPPMKPAFPAA